jgi:SAM-dependent methyltransferase
MMSKSRLFTTLAAWNWFLVTQVGLDFRRLGRSLRGVLPFAAMAQRFRRHYRGPWQWQPCLQDWGEEGGSINNEYFWQDLLVAQAVRLANPHHHVDVGSRLDGFVAHVASFRNLEVFDVRPLQREIPGVQFSQRDLMQRVPEAYCDSLSCLHALEHFGLGRYGDPIDPLGHEKGIANLARLLQPGGTLYLSTPIGRERVIFNANRIFNPRRLLILSEQQGLVLQSLTLISAQGVVRPLNDPEQVLDALSTDPYQLGLFVLRKQ